MWEVGVLGAGQQRPLTFTVQITEAVHLPPDLYAITTTATVADDLMRGLDRYTHNNTFTHKLSLVRQPDLRVTFTHAPWYPRTGASTTVIATIENRGTDAAKDAVITDMVQFTDGVTSTDCPTQVIDITIPIGERAEIACTLDISDTVVHNTPITTVVSVTGTNFVTTSEEYVIQVTDAPHIVSRLSCPGADPENPVLVGELVTYTMTVENRYTPGRIEDWLDFSGSAWLAESAIAPIQWDACRERGGADGLSDTVLKVGEICTGTYTYEMLPEHPYPLQNAVTVTGRTDLDLPSIHGNTRATCGTYINFDPKVRITVTSALTEAEVLDTIPFVITLTHISESDESLAEIDIESSLGGLTTAQCSMETDTEGKIKLHYGDVLTCSMTHIVPRDSRGWLTNTVSAIVKAKSPGEETVQNDYGVWINAPDIILSVTPHTPIVAINQPLTYTIGVSNTGTAAATDLILTAPYPQGTTPIWDSLHAPDISCIWNKFQNRLYCALDMFPVGESVFITYTLVPTQPPLHDGDAITNTVTVETAQLSPVIESAHTRAFASDLTPEKMVLDSDLVSGVPFTYQIVFTNATAVPEGHISDIVLTDTLHTDTNYISGAHSFITETNTAQWIYPTLAAGERLTATVTVSTCQKAIVHNLYRVCAREQGWCSDGGPLTTTLRAPIITATIHRTNLYGTFVFTAAVETDGDPNICKRWHFIDGTYHQDVVTRTYDVPGTYTVTLEVEDPCGHTAIAKETFDAPMPVITTEIFARPAVVTAGGTLGHYWYIRNSGDGLATGLTATPTLPPAVTVLPETVLLCRYPLGQGAFYQQRITTWQAMRPFRRIVPTFSTDILAAPRGCEWETWSSDLIADDTLLPQHEMLVHYDVRVARPITHNLTLTTTAAVAYTQSPTTVVTHTSTTVTARAALSVTADVAWLPDGRHKIGFTVSNPGDTWLRIEKITHTHPLLQSALMEAPAGDTCGHNECRAGWLDVLPYETWSYTTTLDIPYWQITNTTTITAADPLGRVVSATVTFKAPEYVVFNPQVAVTVTSAMTQAEILDTPSFTITLACTADSDHSPAQIEMQSSLGGLTAAECSGDTNADAWLDCGEVWTCPMTYTIPRGHQGALTNWVTVTATAVDGKQAAFYGNYEMGVATPIIGLSNRPHAPIIMAGQPLTYTVAISNTGTATATYPLTVTLLWATDAISVSSDLYNTYQCSPLANQGAVCTLDAPLPISGTVVLTYVVMPAPSLRDGARVTNTVSVESAQFYPLTQPAPDVLVAEPLLRTGKWMQTPSPVAGGLMTYYLTVTNASSVLGSIASNVILTDALPDGMHYVGGDGRLITETNTVEWHFASLEAGETVTASLVVTTCAMTAANADYAACLLTQGRISSGLAVTTQLREPTMVVSITVISDTHGVYTFTPVIDTNGGLVVNWDWFFADDAVSAQETVTRTYLLPGMYTATLQVADRCGFTGTAHTRFNVHPPQVSTVISAASHISATEDLYYDHYTHNHGPGPVTGLSVTHAMPTHFMLAPRSVRICTYPSAQEAYYQQRIALQQTARTWLSRIPAPLTSPIRHALAEPPSGCGPNTLDSLDDLTLAAQHTLHIYYAGAITRPITPNLMLTNTATITYAQMDDTPLVTHTQTTISATSSIDLDVDVRWCPGCEFVTVIYAVRTFSDTWLSDVHLTNTHKDFPARICLDDLSSGEYCSDFFAGATCTHPACREGWLTIHPYQTLVYTHTFKLEEWQLTNTATVTGTDPIGNVVTDTVTFRVPPYILILPVVYKNYQVEYDPVLIATKTGPETARAGDTVLYTVTVRHDLVNGDASPVEITAVEDSLGFTLILSSGGKNEAGNCVVRRDQPCVYTGEYRIPPQSLTKARLLNEVQIEGQDLKGNPVLETASWETQLCPTYYEDFAGEGLNPNGDWPNNGINWGYTVDQKYFVENFDWLSTRHVLAPVRVNTTDSPISIELDAYWENIGFSYGLVFGFGTSSPNQHPPLCVFEVDPVTQRARIDCHNSQRWDCKDQPNNCWEEIPGIQPGSALNTLKVVCENNMANAYLNNNNNPVLSKAVLTCNGGVGLLSKRYQDGARVVFDNFRVSYPCQNRRGQNVLQIHERPTLFSLDEITWNP